MLTGRDMGAEEAERIGLVSSLHDDVVAAGVEIGQRIAAFSQPGIELTKKSLHAGMAATSLETYLHSEGLGQLYLRLLTGNFEEATLARKEGRAAVFTRRPLTLHLSGLRRVGRPDIHSSRRRHGHPEPLPRRSRATPARRSSSTRTSSAASSTS